jgi:hypothetical protein
MAEIKEKTTAQVAPSKVYAFSLTHQSLQVEVIDNEPWFVAKDVCDILSIGNVTDVINRLDDDEKLTSIVSRAGQSREVNLVNESGLYNLIFQSRKPEAKAFRKKVTSEILPAIRRSGIYFQSFRGVEPIVYNGEPYYHYGSVMESFGRSRKHSASGRKSKYPQHFAVIFGRNFVTRRFCELLSKIYANRQLHLDFNAGTLSIEKGGVQ